MQQPVSAIQVLPQPRHLPKVFAWLMYAVILGGLIAAIATLSVAPQQQPHSSNGTTIETPDSPKYTISKYKTPINLQNNSKYSLLKLQIQLPSMGYDNLQMPGNCRTESIVPLEEIVAYECLFEMAIKNVTWLDESDTEISYRDDFGEYTVMNVKYGNTYPSVDPHVEMFFFPWYYIEMPRRYAATLGNCAKNLGPNRKQCYFRIFIISSITEKEPSNYNSELVSQFSQLVNSKPGEYKYIHEETDTEELFMYHKNIYTIHLKSPESNYASTNSCILKFFEEYEFTWHSEDFWPKYIYSVLEICRNYSLTWTNEFTFDPTNPRYKLAKGVLPTMFLMYPAMYVRSHKHLNSHVKWKTYNVNKNLSMPRVDIGLDEYMNLTSNHEMWKDYAKQQKDEKRNKRNLNFTSSATSKSSRIFEMVYRQAEQLTRVSHDLAFRVYKDNYQKHVMDFSDAELKNKKPFSLSRKRRSIRRKMFESIKIASSNWYLHSIIDEVGISNRSFVNLAVSKIDTLIYDMRSHNRSLYDFQWMPRAGDRYRSLLGNDLYVTRILAVRSIGHDEALAYFIAAPIADFSQRLLYQLKIVYPPLEYPTQEIALCMTCPKLSQDNPTLAVENQFNLSTIGNNPICISSNVLMSASSQYYILYCRGPDIPWTAIVSTYTNLVIRQLGGFERFRELSESIQQPLTHQFMVKLEGNHWARARIHFPSTWDPGSEKCNTRLRLLLRLANHQEDQLVTAKYDLSLTSHLATLGRYAVLYADVRASELQNLEFTGMEFRQLEAMQMQDYASVIKHVANNYNCLDLESGIGVLGEAYGGHMALNLLAGYEDQYNEKNARPADKNIFQCCAAIRPFVHWFNYVYPFSMKPFLGIIGSVRRKAYEKQYLSRLTRLLRGKDFTLIGSFPKNDERCHYMNNLLGMFARHGVSFDYREHEDISTCSSRIRLYMQLPDYFDRCFERRSSCLIATNVA